MLGRRKKRTDGAASTTLKLYYASDVHGSDRCLRKFLGAGRLSPGPAVIQGGDLTGKAIVPIAVNGNGAFSATFIGETRSGTTQEELDQLMDAVRFNGMYPWPASREEIERHETDAGARAELFEQVVDDELR